MSFKAFHISRDQIGQFTVSQMKTESEKDLQRRCYLELLRRGLFFHYSRSDKRTTTRLGTPDFGLCLNGKYLAVECKTATGKQSMEQVAVQAAIERQGGQYVICRSFDEFMAILKL